MSAKESIASFAYDRAMMPLRKTVCVLFAKEFVFVQDAFETILL